MHYSIISSYVIVMELDTVYAQLMNYYYHVVGSDRKTTVNSMVL